MTIDPSEIPESPAWLPEDAVVQFAQFAVTRANGETRKAGDSVDCATGGVTSTMLEGARVLEEIEAMSHANATDDSVFAEYYWETCGELLTARWRYELEALCSSDNPRNYSGANLYARNKAVRVLFEQISGATSFEVMRALHAQEQDRIRVLQAQRRERRGKVFVGDRPEGLRNGEITRESLIDAEHRASKRSAVGRALLLRNAPCVDGRFTARALKTHAAICAALAGETEGQRLERIQAVHLGLAVTSETRTEATTGHTIDGCVWCAKAGAP